jgi:hypothetical protein
MSKHRMATLLVASIVAGCAGRGGDGGTRGRLTDQVIVRNDTDPYNVEAAQRIANQQCAARGAGVAQFIILASGPRGGGGGGGGDGGGGGGGGTPDIVFRCVPAS